MGIGMSTHNSHSQPQSPYQHYAPPPAQQQSSYAVGSSAQPRYSAYDASATQGRADLMAHSMSQQSQNHANNMTLPSISAYSRPDLSAPPSQSSSVAGASLHDERKRARSNGGTSGHATDDEQAGDGRDWSVEKRLKSGDELAPATGGSFAQPAPTSAPKSKALAEKKFVSPQSQVCFCCRPVANFRPIPRSVRTPRVAVRLRATSTCNLTSSRTWA